MWVCNNSPVNFISCIYEINHSGSCKYDVMCEDFRRRNFFLSEKDRILLATLFVESEKGKYYSDIFKFYWFLTIGRKFGIW